MLNVYARECMLQKSTLQNQQNDIKLEDIAPEKECKTNKINSAALHQKIMLQKIKE